MLCPPPPVWDLSNMVDDEVLRGQSLYEALVRLKPDGLAETDWAVEAGVNRGFFSNLKSKGNSPRSDTLRKLLRHIGKTEADLDNEAHPRPGPNAIVQEFEGASLKRMRQDLPIIGTALGADKIIEGQAIEQTNLYTGEIIAYAKRPVLLDGRADAYGIYVQGSSMDPEYRDGSLILVETRRTPAAGDNVIIYLRNRGDGDEADDGATSRMVMVKRLVRRSASFLELEQHNPRITFRISTSDVLRMDRVIPWVELLS